MKKLLLASMALLCFLTAKADNGFSIDDFTIAANGEITVQIKMNNDVTFSGFQFDLELPEGVSFKLNKLNKPIVTATDRLKYVDEDEGINETHNVQVTQQLNGLWRVMAYSSSSLDIQGETGGTVLTAKIVASDQVSTGTFTPSFTNIVMTQADETQYKPADCTYNCTVTMSTTVTTLGYASFSWPKALDFTNSGLTAFIATSNTNNSLHLESVTKVPANTGLILKGTAGSENTYPLQTTDDDTDDVSENMLSSNTTGTYTVTTNNVYVLSNLDDGRPGFYLANEGINVGQYKSYLVLSENLARTGLAFDETPTSIREMNNGKSDHLFYDLQGRRVQNPTKGLYVVNGKKTIIK